MTKPIVDFKQQYLAMIKREGRVPSINGELVPMLKVSRQTFYAYRNGDIENPQWRIYRQIADWLGCEMDELILNLDEFNLKDVLASTRDR